MWPLNGSKPAKIRSRSRLTWETCSGISWAGRPAAVAAAIRATADYMTTDRGYGVKAVYFTLEGLSSFSTSLYSYYVYFLMRDEFGFGNKGNLAFAALNGLIYTISAWQAGRFAQRHGYFTALKIGFSVMSVALAAGSQLHSAAGVMVATGLLNVGMCFLWPTIEALVSEGGNAVTLPRAVGTYNVVWASTNALALFGGGTLVEAFGFKVIFYVPLVLCLTQL